MIQVTMGYLKDKELNIYRELIQSFSLTLDKSKVYDIGIDQSTTCTGIAICPLDESFVSILEVLNFDRDAYYVPQLCNLIRKMFSGINIRYMIMEEPLGYVTGRRNNTLTKLKNTLKPLHEELDVTQFGTILPPAWRHGLMPKAGNGDRRKKETVVRTLIDMYPELEGFLPYSNGDYDGLEALGIIKGFKARHGVDDSGGLKIIGQPNTKKRAVAFFKSLPLDDNTSARMNEDMENFKRYIHHKEKLHFKSYNEEHNLYGNVKMCLVDDYSCSIITDELDVIAACIEMKINPEPNSFLFMFVANANKVSDSMVRDLFYNGYSPALF